MPQNKPAAKVAVKSTTVSKPAPQVVKASPSNTTTAQKRKVDWEEEKGEDRDGDKGEGKGENRGARTDSTTVSKIEAVRSKVSMEMLRRSKPVVREEEIPLPPTPISLGAVDRVIDLAFNPSRDKIREVTIVDRMQARLFPQLDMVNAGLHYCLEVAFFRQSSEEYERRFSHKRPMPPDLTDELLYRTAQWQKSVAGKNLERATDIALAETEGKAQEDENASGADAWKE